MLDKRDTLAVGQEVAIWDGYQKWDVCRDSLGNVLFQTNGDTLRCVQYNAAGVPLRSYVYNSFLDLKSKANLFLTPIYEVSTSAMYFNGDDAVAIIEGTNATAASILDVVGVIGIDPGFSWLDAQGGRLTQDKTLQRKDNVRGGTGPVSIQSVPDTFAYNRWIVRGKDTFTGLGTHRCTCEPGIISSVEAVGEVAFSVAPNPIRQGSDLFIEAAQPVQSVAFYNLLGQLISTQNITDTNGRFTCSVPNDLSSGLYLIQLTFTDQRISTRKISVE